MAMVIKLKVDCFGMECYMKILKTTMILVEINKMITELKMKISPLTIELEADVKLFHPC